MFSIFYLFSVDNRLVCFACVEIFALLQSIGYDKRRQRLATDRRDYQCLI